MCVWRHSRVCTCSLPVVQSAVFFFVHHAWLIFKSFRDYFYETRLSWQLVACSQHVHVTVTWNWLEHIWRNTDRWLVENCEEFEFKNWIWWSSTTSHPIYSLIDFTNFAISPCYHSNHHHSNHYHSNHHHSKDQKMKQQRSETSERLLVTSSVRAACSNLNLKVVEAHSGSNPNLIVFIKTVVTWLSLTTWFRSFKI